MSDLSDGPWMDDMGEIFALDGTHRKLHFLKEWKAYTGMTLAEICEGREVWPHIRVVRGTLGYSDEWGEDTLMFDPEGDVVVTAFSDAWVKEADDD